MLCRACRRPGRSPELNISVSSGQYQLVQLQNQRTELIQQNEALTQQVEHHQAPQVLAGAAAELGMVVSPTFGTIDLQTLAVTGNPEPAKEGTGPGTLIELPQVLTTAGNPGTACGPGTGRKRTGRGTAGQCLCRRGSRNRPPRLLRLRRKPI